MFGGFRAEKTEKFQNEPNFLNDYGIFFGENL